MKTTFFPAYQALWPTRYSPEKLAEIRATVSQFWWNAQYQGTPSMGDLGYFEVDRMLPYEFPSAEHCWIAVDAAQTKTDGGSFTAFVCLGAERDKLKVLSVRRGRWRQDLIHDNLLDFYAAMGRLTGANPIAVLVESAAAGYGIIDLLSRQLPIVPVYPRGSKEDRAGSVCKWVNRGQVQLPKEASWLAAFKDELHNFPLSANSDQVDAFVHALSFLSLPSEFRLPQETGVVTYDTLGANYESSFAEENRFDIEVVRSGWRG